MPKKRLTIGQERRLAIKNAYIALSTAEAAMSEAQSQFQRASALYKRRADREICRDLLGLVEGASVIVRTVRDAKRPG